MNNGKYDTLEYKQKQAEKIDRLFGPIKKYDKVCQCCGNKFIFEGRLKTKAYDRAVFCSRSCANNRQAVWDSRISNGDSDGKWVRYRAIAFKYHGEQCVVCKFDKVVEVHHLDHNRSNNSKENLVPLCPNHHQMIHRSSYAEEVLKEVTDYINGLLV
jgi:hypothetical protein